MESGYRVNAIQQRGTLSEARLMSQVLLCHVMDVMSLKDQ